VYQLDVVPKWFLVAVPKVDIGATVEYPALVVLMDINRAVELRRPLVHITVKVRVRKSDGFQAAFAMNKLLSVLIQQRDTIPQNISVPR